MYLPEILSAMATKKYQVGDYEAEFLENIVAGGPIDYEFMIAVQAQGSDEPFLIVTSERMVPRGPSGEIDDFDPNPDRLSEPPGKSHFLCVFSVEGHMNMGRSSNWSNRELFETAALKILEDKLGEKPVAI